MKQEDIKVIGLTKENLEEGALRAQGCILIDSYGDGCVPCIAPAPHIHGFEKVYGKTMRLCSLNTAKAKKLTIPQKVLELPVIAAHKDGLTTDFRMRKDTTPGACKEMVKTCA